MGLYKLLEHWALTWVLTQVEPRATPALRMILGYINIYINIYIPIITWILAAAGLIWVTYKAGRPTPGLHPEAESSID